MTFKLLCRNYFRIVIVFFIFGWKRSFVPEQSVMSRVFRDIYSRKLGLYKILNICFGIITYYELKKHMEN